MKRPIKSVINLYRKLQNLPALSDRRVSDIIDNRLRILQMQQNSIFKTQIATDPKSPLIVSLTTYGKYINEAHLAVESILEQTYKPQKIILWVDEKLGENDIPFALKNLEKRGLEIKKTKDIRSYKKLIPALKMFPENPIVTFDDDIIYHENVLDLLYRAYLKEPEKIHFRRGSKMQKAVGKNFAPYVTWKNDQFLEDDSDYLNFFTTGGGVLFPPHSLDDEVFNEEVFLKICPLADDVWFKAMALKKGTLCHKVYHKEPQFYDVDFFGYDIPNRLCGKNVLQNQNDIQIKAVWDKYNLWEKMENQEFEDAKNSGGGGI